MHAVLLKVQHVCNAPHTCFGIALMSHIAKNLFVQKPTGFLRVLREGPKRCCKREALLSLCQTWLLLSCPGYYVCTWCWFRLCSWCCNVLIIVCRVGVWVYSRHLTNVLSCIHDCIHPWWCIEHDMQHTLVHVACRPKPMDWTMSGHEKDKAAGHDDCWWVSFGCMCVPSFLQVLVKLLFHHLAHTLGCSDCHCAVWLSGDHWSNTFCWHDHSLQPASRHHDCRHYCTAEGSIAVDVTVGMM